MLRNQGTLPARTKKRKKEVAGATDHVLKYFKFAPKAPKSPSLCFSPESNDRSPFQNFKCRQRELPRIVVKIYRKALTDNLMIS